MINKILFRFNNLDNFIKKIRYRKGIYIHKKNKKNIAVSIIMPTFNSEKTIEKAIKSVINLTFPQNQIELIIIDDGSTDTTRQIILKFSKRYSNIYPIFLEHNTGNPSKPRNIGMKFSKGKYIMFLDSDDWLAPAGVLNLYNLLEETSNNYAIGKTIKVSDKKQSIVGPYNSYSLRKFIRPNHCEHSFHHLAPTARMLRKDFLLANKISFPDLKYAEDKYFFIDVLTKTDYISTTNEVIYYANRLSENKSFTKTTTIFEKTDANIITINYVKDKNLPIELESVIINRLIEFDCVTRLFNRQRFLNSNNKVKYYKYFERVLETTKDLRYDFSENFINNSTKTILFLYENKRFDDLIKFIDWEINTKIKDVEIHENKPYYKLPLIKPKQLPISLHAQFDDLKLNESYFDLNLKIWNSNHIINSLKISDRKNELNSKEFPISENDDGSFKVVVPLTELNTLKESSYMIYILYDHYRKAFIKMNNFKVSQKDLLHLNFYTTISDNLGINIKK